MSIVQIRQKTRHDMKNMAMYSAHAISYGALTGYFASDTDTVMR